MKSFKNKRKIDIKNRKNRNKNQIQYDNQNQDYHHNGVHHQQQYQTIQDTKLRLAKQLLKETKINKKKNQLDDFFIQDKINGEIINQNNPQIAQKLKQSYFKDKNRFYQEINSQHYQKQLGEPIIYKGHKKCITGIQITQNNIYSCSKDRSIIKWDRQTLKKDFISLGKQNNHHSDQILSLALHNYQNILATAGEDTTIKLWDTRNYQLIETLRRHKNAVNGISFGTNTLCSVSSDSTLNQWDLPQRSLIQTFYGHRQEALDISTINNNDYISCGNDRQIIVWKTQKQTQVIFQGHEYAIDRVRVVNQQKFLSASMDGSVYLWSQRRKKPLFKFNMAHNLWISALGNISQSNIFATGAADNLVKIWNINELKSINLIRQIPVDGIITDIKISKKHLAFTECDQHRLGRWITSKCKNKIKVYRF